MEDETNKQKLVLIQDLDFWSVKLKKDLENLEGSQIQQVKLIIEYQQKLLKLSPRNLNLVKMWEKTKDKISKNKYLTKIEKFKIQAVIEGRMMGQRTKIRMGGFQ